MKVNPFTGQVIVNEEEMSPEHMECMKSKTHEECMKDEEKKKMMSKMKSMMKPKMNDM